MPKTVEELKGNFLSILLMFVVSISMIDIAMATVIYDESVGGDIDNNNHTINTFQLDAGLNTILGSSYWKTGTNPRVDQDRYAILLGGGLSITSIELTFSNLDPITANSLIAGSILWQASPSLSIVQTLRKRVVDDALLLDDASLPFDSSTYWGNVGSFSVNFAECDQECNWDYDLTFTVVDTNAVNEPATLLLMGFGIASIGFLRRLR